MPQLIRYLLWNSNFWIVMAGLAFLCALIAGPLGLLVPLPFLALMVFVLGVDNFISSRTFPKILKWSGIVLAWFFTAGLMMTLLNRVGLDVESDAGLVAVGLLNVTLWAAPVVLYRRSKRRRAEVAAQRAESEARRARAEHDRSSAQQAAAGRRRADARARCELFFDLHAPEIGARFTKAQFDEYARRHLGEDQGPDYVEKRAGELLDIMQRHLEKTPQAERKKSLADIATWFLEEKGKIEALPMGPDDKNQLVADLEARFTQLQQKYIRSLQP